MKRFLWDMTRVLIDYDTRRKDAVRKVLNVNTCISTYASERTEGWTLRSKKMPGTNRRGWGERQNL